LTPISGVIVVWRLAIAPTAWQAVEVSPSDLRLKTARLVLRPLEADDAEELWPFVSDPEVPRFMTWEAHRTLAETQSFIARMTAAREAASDLAWAILHDGRIVGLIGLHGITRNHVAWRVDRAELGYWIGQPHQNQGFATEAGREVLRFGFSDLGLHKITVGYLKENQRSKGVIEKLGFRFVGEQRDHAYRFGRWWDHLAYELLAVEWQPMRDIARTDSPD
jgi:[ribosomal protein S5]-alanine N-acetyltransferase